MIEPTIMSNIRHHGQEVVDAVREMHHGWMADCEIGERLGLETLVVWHLRQHHNINRHHGGEQ